MKEDFTNTPLPHESPPSPIQEFADGPHEAADDRGQEAIEFVERHRDLFEAYARGAVELRPAPKGTSTFSFNLVNNTIDIHPMFYREQGLSDQQTAFATMHEIEHFEEKKQILTERGGPERFKRYLDRIQESKAFSLMDNCVADIRENRAVVMRNNEAWGDIEQECYRRQLFPEIDFTKEPKHIQLPYALLREARVPGEQCTVDPLVRERLDALSAIKAPSGRTLLDVMTDPRTPMSKRLMLQDKYIWPLVQELLKQDSEEHKKNKKQGKGGKGGGKEGDEGQGTEGQEDSEPKEGTDSGKETKGKQGKEKGAPSKKGKGASSQGDGEAQKGSAGDDPNELFKEAYERAKKKVLNAVPAEDEEKALEEWCEHNGEDPLRRAEAEYAKNVGVSPEALRQYRAIVASLENLRNPQTNESVVDELRTLIKRIIAHRLKPAPLPRYPVEEGDTLIDPVELITQVRGGNLYPRVWETEEVAEKKGKRFGEIELSLVADRSGSMDEKGGAKRIEQQRAAVLFMEALKDLGDACEEERMNLEVPLSVQSEIWSFQASNDDKVPRKAMSDTLTEKERISVADTLATTPGERTTDFVPLETIFAGLSATTLDKIKEGELKKIVVVFTDGDSNDPSRVGRVCATLREKGIVVVGVGITEDGAAALTTYAPDARLAPVAEALPNVLGGVLAEHLVDL
jgi:hypothetical protein